MVKRSTRDDKDAPIGRLSPIDACAMLTGVCTPDTRYLTPVSPIPDPVSPIPEPVSHVPDPVSHVPNPVSPIPNQVSPIPNQVSLRYRYLTPISPMILIMKCAFKKITKLDIEGMDLDIVYGSVDFSIIPTNAKMRKKGNAELEDS